jgi:voltage-gated sodium channel
MKPLAQTIVAAQEFQRAVLALIVFSAVLVGLETFPALLASHGALLKTLDRAVLVLFVAELALRIAAHGRQPWRFFSEPWNVFDFTIVAVCVLPFSADYAAVLRLARVLRALRLITALPRLRILVNALLKSIPSMSYVALLLGLLFYVYAVIGVKLFGAQDPEHFAHLGAAALTLFQVVTLEGWADILRAQLVASPTPLIAIGYFVSFILIGTMIVLNLLIGVIVGGMDEARQEIEDADRARSLAVTGRPSEDDDLVALQRQVDDLHKALTALRHRLKE